VKNATRETIGNASRRRTEQAGQHSGQHPRAAACSQLHAGKPAAAMSFRFLVL
jgi:hypothetical protein